MFFDGMRRAIPGVLGQIMKFDFDDHRCANLICGCKIPADDVYCCEACGLSNDTLCHCNHGHCISSSAAVRDAEPLPFFAGRLL
jgi:hypothetical protein